jgi:hypothetical protein
MENPPDSKQLSRFILVSLVMVGLFTLACVIVALAPPLFSRMMGKD